jgi:hypothetical protein
MTNDNDSKTMLLQMPIRQLAAETAKLIGCTLVAEAQEEPNRRDVAEIEGAGEIRLFWFSPWRPKDRIEIIGQYPNWHDKYSTQAYNPGERVSITIARDSSPEHAARQIKRRLLPGYLAQLDEAKRQRAEFRDRNEKQAHVVQMLESAGARRNPRQKGRLDIEFASGDDGRHRFGDFKVCDYDATVDIELRNLTPEQAAAVLRALAT